MSVLPPDGTAAVTVATLGERALIERIRSRAGSPPAFVVLGIGDDAAVLAPERGRLDVVTTDTLVEHVHFQREWTGAAAIGAKAAAVNFSDLAAMGATPRAVLLSLCLPADLSVNDFDALVDGVVSASAHFGAALVGGNISRSPGPLVVTLTATGAAGRRRILTRSGGRSGEDVYVTGTVGGAAAGLAILQAGMNEEPSAELADCVSRYQAPVARVRCGRTVAGYRAASACLDLSDGLAEAARQLAEASGVGVVLEAEAIPVHPGARTWFTRQGLDPVAAALTGGEDYELLFAVPRKRQRAFAAAVRRSGLTATRVGRLVSQPAAFLARNGREERLPAGFTHFGPSDSESAE